MALNSIAFIPDGNRRFAQKQGISLIEAYRMGTRKAWEVFGWLNNYPEMRTQGKPTGYSIRDTGELDISCNTTYTAKLPPGVRFNATGMFAVGEENAGITGISNASIGGE